MTRHKLSLLERAQLLKTTRTAKRHNEQELELVLAWLNDSITISQVALTMKFKSISQAYSFLAMGARTIHRRSKGE